VTAETPWMVLAEVCEYARGGRDEVLTALADGSLRGYQVKPGGKWRIHRDDVDTWLRGEQAQPIDARFTGRRAG
jgi:excisionase family DNA binding protein